VIVNLIGIGIGLLGFAFAIYERFQRVRVESIVRDTLRRLAGDMRVVFVNANWTNHHLRSVGHLFIQADLDLNKIRAETFDAARDAASCARQLGLEHSKIRGIQKTLFNDSEEILPEIPADDVNAAVAILESKLAAQIKSIPSNAT
jgi:hypothetical protein